MKNDKNRHLLVLRHRDTDECIECRAIFGYNYDNISNHLIPLCSDCRKIIWQRYLVNPLKTILLPISHKSA